MWSELERCLSQCERMKVSVNYYYSQTASVMLCYSGAKEVGIVPAMCVARRTWYRFDVENVSSPSRR